MTKDDAANWRIVRRRIGWAGHLLFGFLIYVESGHAFAENPVWSGETGFAAAYSRTGYVTKSVTMDGEFQYRAPTYRITGDWNAWKESALLKDAPEARSHKYDMVFKYMRPILSSDNYLYFSPRFRGNSNGEYLRSSAIRIGGGREWRSGEGFSLFLEAGIGYRWVLVTGEGYINEKLKTISSKFRWAAGGGVVLKMAASHEESFREKYRTVETSIKQSLAKNFGVRYSLTYRRTFPFDSVDRNGELRTTLGFSYDY